MAKKKTALIYERIQPVTSKRYARHSVDVGRDFRFATGLEAIPALAEEFPSLARICPIVFAGSAEAPMPNALLGMKKGQNVFIGPNGGWAAPYIPAFLRRYPFISAPTKEGGKTVLCVDDAFVGLNTAGKGHALFTSDGVETKFLRDVNLFVSNFDAGLEATRAFVGRLVARNLLEPMSIRITDSAGETTGGIGGMFGLSRARFDALGPDARAELKETGDLERCALHLKSLEHIRRAGQGAKRPAPPTRH
ncbi:MAG: SapC family protein [Rhodobacteraceae bacterium]|nr:SapC family protein [Paracoccaceae bacterium]